MTNDFAIRMGVLEDAEILERCRALYSRDGMQAVMLEYEDASRRGGAELDRWRGRYLRRMWHLGEFMKTLKQKFTLWFNRKHGREGTLWERRYQSVLVEGSWDCLRKVAAYIDLNAVRAGMVADPKDYRWCGYAEAVVGDPLARRGLATALRQSVRHRFSPRCVEIDSCGAGIAAFPTTVSINTRAIQRART